MPATNHYNYIVQFVCCGFAFGFLRHALVQFGRLFLGHLQSTFLGSGCEDPTSLNVYG